MIKRSLDILISLSALIILSVPLLFIYLAVRLTSHGPALHYSKRVGRYNKLFLMPKFRSMRIDTPQLATHLLDNPQSYLTPIGNFIRKSSFDELPQLISVLKGDMSIVGPRPALFNQNDLVELRTKFGIERLKPGITGWAQINGRDEIPIPVKVGLDKYYLDHKSIVLDLKIILFTALKVLRRDGIQH